MSTILNIEESDFRVGRYHYSGFIITTNGGDIQLGIDNSQQCCENWGYLMSQDDFSDYIGATVLSVAGTDDKLAHVEVPKLYEGSITYVNIETSAGLLQFVAYNDHNGYYSHEAVAISCGCEVLRERL